MSKSPRNKQAKPGWGGGESFFGDLSSFNRRGLYNTPMEKKDGDKSTIRWPASGDLDFNETNANARSFNPKWQQEMLDFFVGWLYENEVPNRVRNRIQPNKKAYSNGNSNEIRRDWGEVTRTIFSPDAHWGRSRSRFKHDPEHWNLEDWQRPYDMVMPNYLWHQWLEVNKGNSDDPINPATEVLKRWWVGDIEGDWPGTEQGKTFSPPWPEGPAFPAPTRERKRKEKRVTQIRNSSEKLFRVAKEIKKYCKEE